MSSSSYVVILLSVILYICYQENIVSVAVLAILAIVIILINKWLEIEEYRQEQKEAKNRFKH
jgi:predicted membrane protein